MEKEVIYQEELVRIIKPIKARIYDQKYEKFESYGEDGTKIILFREKEVSK